MSDPCTVCVPTANPNYTTNTFDLRICIPYDLVNGGPGEWVDIGDIQTGSLNPVEEMLEHFRGQTGLLDAAVISKRHWEITAEIDEMTAQNFSIVAGAPMINEDGGCLIPLLGPGAVQLYAAELIHTFPNGVKTFTAHFWSAQVIGDWEWPFAMGSWSALTMTIKAFACTEAYAEGRPYGYGFFNEPCPTS